MKINASEVRKCLKSFDFKTLFREHLGWGVQDKNVKRRRESFFWGLWISRDLDILRLP
jgi:hypothetical protein